MAFPYVQSRIKTECTLIFTACQDNLPEHLISTYPVPVDTVERGVLNANGNYTKIKVQRPGIIGDYNLGMGGTDKNDQRISYYRTGVRSRRWPIRIFFHMLSACVVNSFILYMKTNQTEGETKMPLLKYMLKLVEEMKQGDNYLDEEWKEVPESDDEEMEASGNRKRGWKNNREFRKTSQNFAIKSDSRGQCVVCVNRSLTNNQCERCKAFLYSVSPDGQNCFKLFHIREYFCNTPPKKQR